MLPNSKERILHMKKNETETKSHHNKQMLQLRVPPLYEDNIQR